MGENKNQMDALARNWAIFIIICSFFASNFCLVFDTLQGQWPLLLMTVRI